MEIKFNIILTMYINIILSVPYKVASCFKSKNNEFIDHYIQMYMYRKTYRSGWHGGGETY